MVQKILAFSACLFIIAFSNSFASHLYKVNIDSREASDYLNTLDIQPVLMNGNEYLLLADDESVEIIRDASISINLIAENISLNQLAVNRRPDFKNTNNYPVLYEENHLKLYLYDLKGGYDKDLSLISRTPDRFIYRPKATLQPQLSYADIDLESLIDLVIQDSVEAHLFRLEAFHRRLAGTDSSYAARDWITGKFESFGYDSVYIDMFTGSQLWDRVPVTSYNVIATKLGSLYPDRQIIVGGHFDAVPDCPGADDDGTGTAGVIEIARILAEIETEMTIVFIAFDSEESWMWGSYHYVDDAMSRNDNIIYMMNLDMIGHITNSNRANLYYGSVLAYSELWKTLADSLVGISAEMAGYSPSDHLPFQENGYDVTFVQEYDFSTEYHKPSDSTSYINFEYMTRMIKASLASLYVIDKAPLSVKITSAYDSGNGHAYQINWSGIDRSDVDFYRVYYDTEPPSGLDSIDLPAPVTSIMIEGLIEGQEYSVYVIAFNSRGNSSLIKHPFNFTPLSLPRSPFLLHASPSYRSIQLSWINQNTELDFSHYAIIRDGLMLPVEVTGDSYLDDDFVLGNSLHSYFVVAVDTYGNLSDTTGVIPVESRAAILEPGKMLVVNRSCMQSSAIVDEAATGQFMRDALAGYTFDYLSDSAYCTLGESFDIYQLLDYEVVVLGAESGRTDNFGTDTIFGGVLTVLDKYMSFGGKVIMFGRYGDITSGSNDYKDITFNPGTSDYAYYSRFHINLRRQYLTTYVGLTFHSDLIGAHSAVTGYPDLVWDSLATVAHSIPWNTCTGIPCPTYVNLHGSGWEILYTYDSRTDQVPNEGKPVAWRYTGGAYEYILFELPLSFMEPASASLALQTAVSELLSSGWAGVTAIEPDTVDADNLPLTVSILLGDLWESKTAGDVDVSEILINGTVSPASTTVLASHPDFSGEVLQIDISPTDFIGSYSMLIDTNTYGYKVNWEFIGEDDVQSIYGGVTLLGTRLLDGDANGDGVINLGDAIFLINYIFKGGPAPDPLDLCDGNCDGHCNLGDAIFLINYIFKGGTAPGCG